MSTTGIPVSRAEVVTAPPTDFVSTDQNGYFVLAEGLYLQQVKKKISNLGFIKSE